MRRGKKRKKKEEDMRVDGNRGGGWCGRGRGESLKDRRVNRGGMGKGKSRGKRKVKNLVAKAGGE